MINLNGNEFAGTTAIFNNGEAGVAKNVEIKIEPRAASEPETYPDYKLIVTDSAGASINQGFYHYVNNDNQDAEYNSKRQNQEISRVLHIAKAVMGNDYTFPQVNSPREAVNMLFKLILENAPGKKFNVFVTYGTNIRPNKKGYIGLRYFNFIEPATENSRFRVSATDLMERPSADAPSTNTSLDSTPAPKVESWT